MRMSRLSGPRACRFTLSPRLARERVVVVLTGEGADETLAGYTRYAFTLKNAAMDRAYRSVVPSVLRRAMRNSVATSSLLGATLRRKLEHTFVGKDGEAWDSFYFDNFFSAFSGAEQGGLLTREFAQQLRRQARPTKMYWHIGSIRRSKAARCCNACSIPTSRPTSSNC